jgi:hypothetical protein
MSDQRETHEEQKARILRRLRQVREIAERADIAAAPYLDYKRLDIIVPAHWGSMRDALVRYHLIELLNGVNQFRTHINKLNAWAKLFEEIDRDESHDLAISEVQSLAYFCLCQPYAIKERFIHVAIQVLHQANMSSNPRYPDRLDIDPKIAHEMGRWHKKQKMLEQMDKVGLQWSGYPAFRLSLDQINSREFERLTHGFRTGAQHTFQIGIEIGITPPVTRSVQPWLEKVQQPDGTFTFVTNSTRMCAAYGLGGIPPLTVSNAVLACVPQHVELVRCYDAFHAILEEAIEKITNQSA